MSLKEAASREWRSYMIFSELLSRKFGDPLFINSILLNLDAYLLNHQFDFISEEAMLTILGKLDFDVIEITPDVLASLPDNTKRLKQAIQTTPEFDKVVSNFEDALDMTFQHSNVEQHFALEESTLNLLLKSNTANEEFAINKMVRRLSTRFDLAQTDAKNLLGVALGLRSGNFMQHFANELEIYAQTWMIFLGSSIIDQGFFVGQVKKAWNALHPISNNRVEMLRYLSTTGNNRIFKLDESIFDDLSSLASLHVSYMSNKNDGWNVVYQSAYHCATKNEYNELKDNLFHANLYKFCVTDSNAPDKTLTQLGRELLLRSILIEAYTLGVTFRVSRDIRHEQTLSSKLEADLAAKCRFFYQVALVQGSLLHVHDKSLPRVNHILSLVDVDYEPTMEDLIGFDFTKSPLEWVL